MNYTGRTETSMIRMIYRAAIPPLLAAACSTGGAAPPAVDAVTFGSGAAGNPTVALDAARGAAYVVWVEAHEQESNVMIARLDARGRPAGEPVRVNAAPGDASRHEAAPPQVAVGPGGEVYVAWESSYPVEGRRFPASHLRFARSADGGRSFGATVTVNSDADGPPSGHSFHNLAVAADGTIYVSWIDSRERDRARRERVAQAGAVAAAAAAAPHAHGASASADDELPGAELWVAVSHDGGASFRETAVVDRDICPCCRTGLAIGPGGEVYVAWRSIADGQVRDIAIARSDDGARSFGAPRPVHRDGWVFHGCPHAGPTVAVGDDGDVHVAWYTGVDGAAGTYYAVSRDGGRGFAAPVPLLTGDWMPPSIARVAAHGNDVRVAWDDRREERGDRSVHVARVVDGRLARETVVRGSTPDLALGAGRGLLAWHHGDTVLLRHLGE